MDIDRDFPYKLFINLAKRGDRRAASEEEFLRNDLNVIRLPAVNSKRVRDSRGMLSAGRYACGLSQRLAIRKARNRREKALLLFEDDVVLHENFREMTESLMLPEDWGIFYFGCQHIEKPERVSPGIVRVTRALDMHAFAIRDRYYNEVLRALRPAGKRSLNCVEHSDVALADLHDKIPTYAAYPNLAWQRHNQSDLASREYSSYNENGSQKFRADSVLEYEQEQRLTEDWIFSRSGLKLHLGCGNTRLTGSWVNLERGQCNICKPLPFSDASAKYIFLEHVIEHITAREAWRFFEECVRVLEPGGVLRLAFPCIERIGRSNSHAYADFMMMMGWGDGSLKSSIEALIFENDHKAVWTGSGMQALLQSFGFSVTLEEVGWSSRFPDLQNLEQHWREVGEEINCIETVCIDAQKPFK